MTKIFEERPWGSFKVLLEEPGYKVKEITVKPHSKLSLQSHKHREEFWVTVQGTALALCEETEHELKQGASLHIPKGAKHRLINKTSEPVVIIETQLGDYLGEDDIERFEDEYKRV
ncbi:MAG: phosphomannose isomerase type II C-terminal cupin domain [Alphaproteobacteria bacterium]